MLPMQPGDVPATFADVSRLAAAVGFAPRTPIEDGIGIGRIADDLVPFVDRDLAGQDG